MVQRAVVLILAASCEHDFHAFSHGFRKGPRPHQALHELREQCRKVHINWIGDADVSGFFDNLDWSYLREFIQQRVIDGRILRLIGKWLHAGVLEVGALIHPDKGTPQGGVISPMFANVFLHHVLDGWFVTDVQPRMKGQCLLTRFAEDLIIGCPWEADARRVMAVLPKRFARFRLTIHPENTVLIAFKRPPSRAPSAGGTGTFAFLGFTHSWGKTRQGYWVIKRKTIGTRLRRFMKESWTWCRAHRHEPLQEQYRTLCAKLRGYDQYYGIRGNFKRLEVVFEHLERAWHYWLSTRSHKGRIHWQKFEGFLRQHLPLATPRIMPHIEEGQGQQSDAPNGVSPVWFASGVSWWLPRNRMRSLRTSGSVGRAPGNRRLYPEGLQVLLVVRTDAGEQPRVDLVHVVAAAHDGAEVLTILGEGDGAALGQFEALPHALHTHVDIAAVGEGHEGIGRLHE